MAGDANLTRARERMVEIQLARRGIRSPAVLDAMRSVPRERFVQPGMEEFAYEDGPLPIPEGQTISQPFIVALMIEAAALGPHDRVLEVGAGSGYAAAVIGRIAKEVFAVERHPALAEAARERLAELAYGNVSVRAGDGTLGWPEEAPFDAIIVSAGGPDAPEALKRQLKAGGRLVIPVGAQEGGQTLKKFTRQAEDAWDEEGLCGVFFVPLIGVEGWSDGTPGLPARDRSR